MARSRRDEHVTKEEAAAPTVALESVFMTATIDAKEKQEVVTIYIPGAFLHANNDDYVIMKMNGLLAELMVKTSEAAPCPLQPCYFDKWDLFADTWDCQYAMGFPLCIFKYLGVSLHNFVPIFPIS